MGCLGKSGGGTPDEASSLSLFTIVSSVLLQVHMPSLGGYGGFRGDLGPLPGARKLPDVQRLPAELTFDFTIRND